MGITFNSQLFDTDGTFETYVHEILVDGIKVGRADTITDTDDTDETYLEWIGIDDDFQNKGIGTQAIKMLAEKYGFIYFAPCDEDNVRCYERFAEIYEGNAPEVSQGFGVYFLEK